MCGRYVDALAHNNGDGGFLETWAATVNINER